MDCFTLKNLNFSYPEQTNKALDNLSLSIQKGAFVILCGPSGCGKSTLLRQLKTVLSPHGEKTGEILFEGTLLEQVDNRTQAKKIGYVSQSPENQIVTDKVWHELAFGLESLGFDTATIRKRVAEMASFFGIENWFYKTVAELSGGQKQLLSLASVMVMQPSVLILDEPTAQLDPIAAADFLSTIAKINREFGTTVILTEHRLEEAFPYATKAAVMEKGKILCCDTPQNAGMILKEKGHGMFLAMPSAMRVWAGLESDANCPITVREGSLFLSEYAKAVTPKHIEKQAIPRSNEVIMKAEEVWFRYDRDLPDILKGFTFTLHKGEFFALLGGNGTGKTTALKVLAGLKSVYRGKVKTEGKIGVLPQNPQTLFIKKSVREDLFQMLTGKQISKEEKEKKIAYVSNICEIRNLLDRHPYDISGGEQQRAALAKVLLTEPDILLLDEPTKGFDAEFKAAFACILNKLLLTGVSIFMVSHDTAFCAEYAHFCGLFFDGNIVTSGTPEAFFSGNNFYTTSANRMARHILPDAVTVNDIISSFSGKLEETADVSEEILPLPKVKETAPAWKPKPLPVWRKLLAGAFGTVAAGVFIYATKITDLTKFINSSGITDLAKNQLWIYAALIISLFGVVFSIGRRSAPPVHIQTPKEKRKLTKRTLLAALMILCCIPLTLFTGIFYLKDRSYGIISILILLECMLPFFLVFEGRKPKARELVIIAVLCAIGIAGRAAFFMLPQFKPVMALTIIAGAAFGGETGFMVGSVTMLASNMLFSQGPWTPWQMFCMGIVGFLAGILFRKGLLRCGRVSLAVFGAIGAIVIYGGIINPASVLIWTPSSFSWKTILASYISGFPMDLIHAFATVFFLLVAAEPMLEKLNRLKVKYGLTE